MDTVAVLNQPAPGFHLPDLEGHFHSLSDFQGKVVIVNFWSAECPWSERVDHELLSLMKTWGDSVVLLTIAANTNEPLELLRHAAEARGLPLVLRDAEQSIVRAYGAQTTPHCFVVDGSGILRYRGAFDDRTFRQRQPTRTYLREVVEALLNGKSPGIAEPPAYGCAIVSI